MGKMYSELAGVSGSGFSAAEMPSGLAPPMVVRSGLCLPEPRLYEERSSLMPMCCIVAIEPCSSLQNTAVSMTEIMFLTSWEAL